MEHKTFPLPPSDLPLCYGSSDEGEREVAAFVLVEGTWLYHSRGTASEAVKALRSSRQGFIGGLGGMEPESVQVCLDQPSWGSRDSKDLCWCGPHMTVDEFKTWYQERM